MKDWRYWLGEHRGTLLALVFFVLMFAIYVGNHPAGFTANVVQTAANKGVLLALVAMAQTFVVLTAGIDLSVGMVLVLDELPRVLDRRRLAAHGRAGCRRRAAAGAVCGAINGVIVIYGRLQPIVTTIATGAIYFGIALALRPVPGGDVDSDLADALTGRLFGGIPTSLVLLLVVVLVIWLPFRRSEIGRAAYAIGSSEPAAYMSGVPIRAASFLVYVLSGLIAAIGGLFLTFITDSGEASAANGGTYTLYSIAAVVLGGVSLFGGSRQRDRRDLRRLHVPHHRRPAVRLRSRAALAAAVPGRRAAGRRLPRLGAAVPDPQPARPLRMSTAVHDDARRRSGAGSIRRSRPPSAASSCCCFSAASIPRASCRPTTCCSSSRSPRSSASSPPA